jgi:hypothetical protein
MFPFLNLAKEPMKMSAMKALINLLRNPLQLQKKNKTRQMLKKYDLLPKRLECPCRLKSPNTILGRHQAIFYNNKRFKLFN